ncbi:NlpC/P60 family protein [Methylobrevis pamukkalensis]|uniref:NlpC/P60 family protein n=1 Tax=Methylobrevis pamukkalensis TaxID=1439726 RepID=UPI001FD94505|nr:NlpC/P60 family protein [Methylobrevis pamukkalensis]
MSGFVGIPYADLGRSRDGADCYGLLCLVYAEIAGVTLASGLEAYPTAEDRAAVDAVIHGGLARGPWHPVIGAVQPLDAALFRRGRHASHVGVILSAGRMLHIGDTASVIERYDAPVWRDRLLGIHRHEALMRPAGG